MNQASTDPKDVALNSLNALIGDDPQRARQHIRSLPFQGRVLLAAWAGELSRITRDEQNDYEAAERRAARETGRSGLTEDEARRLVREHITHLRVAYGYVKVAPGDFITVLAETSRPRPWLTDVLKDLSNEGVLSPDPNERGKYLTTTSL